jgi:hypothetical protein
MGVELSIKSILADPRREDHGRCCSARRHGNLSGSGLCGQEFAERVSKADSIQTIPNRKQATSGRNGKKLGSPHSIGRNIGDLK